MIVSALLGMVVLLSHPGFSQTIRIPGTEVDEPSASTAAQTTASAQPVPPKANSGAGKPVELPGQVAPTETKTPAPTLAASQAKEIPRIKTSKSGKQTVPAPKIAAASDSLPAIPLTPFIPANP